MNAPRTTDHSPSVALVTGGSAGLGLELTRALVAEGWTVVVDGRRPEVLSAAAATTDGPGRLVIVAGDVTDAAHRTALVAHATSAGPVRLVVNNASTLGASPQPTLDELTPTTFEAVLRTNVVAPIALVAELAPHLGAGTTIVDVTSDAFPGEDISDRPLPAASVPGLLALIHGDQPSGRYEARAFEPAPVP